MKHVNQGYQAFTSWRAAVRRELTANYPAVGRVPLGVYQEVWNHGYNWRNGAKVIAGVPILGGDVGVIGQDTVN